VAKTTKLVRDEAYEAMGMAYQCVQAAMLDAALQEHGIAGPAVRRQVCETFVFEMGNLHDQGWFKPFPESEPVYPLLCFTTQFLNVDSPVGKLGTVYAPSGGFAYHESAFGCVGEFYEDVNVVETGDFGDGTDDA